jgi:sigma-B regulation protein RsbU (phosphoserine phosphatase)
LEHLQKELNLARQLQASMLPLQRPLFEGRMDLDICGFMEPASNVGGDLFDAFFTRENELFFCIGDVSGHGIASALFMARTVGLVRTLALGTPQPHILLGLLNDSLCQANDTNIFVTMFCGLLQVDTGVLTYSNGGHCPPMVVSKGIPHMLPLPKGPLIGAIPGARFLTLEANLEIGDTLFCYTDGVTEAENPQGQEFSEEKCQSIVAEQPLLPIDALLGRVRSSVATFTETSVLEDDCTMLALRRLPSP